MRTIIASLMLILLIVGTTPTCADVIRVDPNTPQAAAQAEPEQQIDLRLAQKVTYEARKQMVSTILADLSEQTGVTLNAGYNSKDWQVRDRKMNIFATDVTLAHLMNSIARVMKFKWSKSEDSSTPSYRLYMDRRTLLNAESQKAREEERYKEQQAEKRRNTLQRFAEIRNLSPKELAKLKEEDPFLYIAKTSGVADSLATVFGEIPAAVEALANGQEMTMSASRMSSAAQNGLLQAMQSLNKFEGMLSKRDSPLPDDLAQNIGQVSVTINRSLSMMEGQIGQNPFLGDISMNYNGRNIGVPIFDPDSTMAKMFGRIVVKSMDEGRPIDEIAKGMEGELMQAMIAERKESSFGEPRIEHENEQDPALEKKVKLDVQKMGRELLGVEAELAETTGLAVVSDYFGMTHGFTRFDSEETEVREILETIADGYNYNWDKQQNVIELRDREWFRKRAAQIPEEWLEDWRQALKENGTLSLDELAQIAALTMEQIRVNIISDELLMRANLAGAVFAGRDILRFYSSLNQQQKQLLMNDTGLSAAMLSPEQWSQLERLITRRNGAFLEDPNATITLTAEQVDDRYHFECTTTAPDINPILWVFAKPKYVEPKDEVKTSAPEKKQEAE